MSIPKTLDEAVEILYTDIKKQQKDFYEKVKNGQEKLSSYHHTTGRNIRNSWGLWAGSDLRDFFFDLGLYHADDMSGIIFESVQAKIRGNKFDVDAAVKYYQDFWEDQGINTQEKIKELQQ